MISNKVLRGLKKGNYLLYDNIYNYLLAVHGDNSFHLCSYINYMGYYGDSSCYIFEKDLEQLVLNAKIADDYESLDFYKNTYIDNKYTNKWSTVNSVGGLSFHSDFYWRSLKLFGEYKNEETIKELNRFKKLFKKQ